MIFTQSRTYSLIFKRFLMTSLIFDFHYVNTKLNLLFRVFKEEKPSCFWVNKGTPSQTTSHLYTNSNWSYKAYNRKIEMNCVWKIQCLYNLCCQYIYALKIYDFINYTFRRKEKSSVSFLWWYFESRNIPGYWVNKYFMSSFYSVY
jgi:hypothetical protein